MATSAASLESNSLPRFSGSLTEDEPMPQNDVHRKLLLLLVNNLLLTLTRRRPDVDVLSDVFWIDQRDARRIAPDIAVAFGVDPSRWRSSFVTEDEGVPISVCFEIISPSDDNPLDPRHVDSLPFRYEARGVDEYVEFHTVTGLLRIFDRSSGAWREVADPWSWVSPLTGFHAVGLAPAGRFGHTLRCEGLDGPYLSAVESAAQLDAAAVENRRLRERLLAEGIDPDET